MRHSSERRPRLSSSNEQRTKQPTRTTYHEQKHPSSRGALERHGRGPLRALLVQSAKKLLLVDNPLQKWSLAVAARRGRNKATAAVARKLAVAVWHVMQGHPIGAIENVPRLRAKVFKLATDIGLTKIKAAGHKSKNAFIEDKLILLTSYP